VYWYVDAPRLRGVPGVPLPGTLPPLTRLVSELIVPNPALYTAFRLRKMALSRSCFASMCFARVMWVVGSTR